MAKSAELKDAIALLGSMARKEHYYSEDCWHSCPKAEGGCCDESKTGCTCDADEHNVKVDKLLVEIEELLNQDG